MLVHLGGKHDAATVRGRVGTAMSALPAHLRKTLTWDHGSEVAEYLQFKEETLIPVYFCDAHSPWQRGSNENTNGLIRQYFPKGTNLNLCGPNAWLRSPPRSTPAPANHAIGSHRKPTSIGSKN
jgi:IS30 family transposase